MLEHDAQGACDQAFVKSAALRAFLTRAQREQCVRPVDGLGDPGRFDQVTGGLMTLAQPLTGEDDLLGEKVGPRRWAAIVLGASVTATVVPGTAVAAVRVVEASEPPAPGWRPAAAPSSASSTTTAAWRARPRC